MIASVVFGGLPIDGRCRLPVAANCPLLQIARCCQSPVAADHPSLPIARPCRSPIAANRSSWSGARCMLSPIVGDCLLRAITRCRCWVWAIRTFCWHLSLFYETSGSLFRYFFKLFSYLMLVDSSVVKFSKVEVDSCARSSHLATG